MAAGDRRARLGNAELQYYTAETANAALDGAGHLAIRVRRDNRRYTSGRLITKNLRSVRYGLIEASIKIPGGRGIWPAFWLLGTDPAAVHGAVHGPGSAGSSAGPATTQ